MKAPQAGSDYSARRVADLSDASTCPQKASRTRVPRLRWLNGPFLCHLDEAPDGLGPVGPLPYQYGLYSKGRMIDRTHFYIASQKADEALWIYGYTKPRGYQSKQCQRVRRLQADIHGDPFRGKHVVESPAIGLPLNHVTQDQTLPGEVCWIYLAKSRKPMI